MRNKPGKGATYMSYTELKNQVHSLVLICILFQVDFSKIKIFSNNNFKYNETVKTEYKLVDCLGDRHRLLALFYLVL